MMHLMDSRVAPIPLVGLPNRRSTPADPILVGAAQPR